MAALHERASNFVIRNPLGLSEGRCFGVVFFAVLVTAFNSYRKKMGSLVDVKLERGHPERIKKVVGKSIRAKPGDKLLYKTGKQGEKYGRNTYSYILEAL